MPATYQTQPFDSLPLAPTDTGPGNIGFGGTDLGSQPGSGETGTVPIAPRAVAPTSNPLYSSQWHLGLIGDITTVWEDYTGTGVSVAIYDDGVQASHPDLVANYDSAAELTLVDSTPNSSSDGHGTSVAGLIAAANNSIGGVGVAYGAKITGVDYLNDAFQLSYAEYIDVLEAAANFDVINNSWGSIPVFNEYTDIGEAALQAGKERQAIAYTAETGRDGLGTVWVKAAGNYANDSEAQSMNIMGNAHGDGLNNLHELITVAATGSTGFVASYSNWGHCLLIAAPAASVTSDRTGSAGYDSGDYTYSFGGTSAATPIVTGVIALMLEANPDLHWRDVQNILAASAAQTGSQYGSAASGYEQAAWTSNGATTWNGGGMSYSMSYGYGMVDARAAVRMAEIWTRIFPDTGDHLATRSASNTTAIAIADDATTEMSITLDGDTMLIDHLYVTVDYAHGWDTDLTISLVAPNGMVIPLKINDGFGYYNADWTYGISSLRGMTDGGTWTLRIVDGVPADTGTLRSFRLDFEGQTLDTDDVYTFTDDFLELAAAETARTLVTETNGGTDWINAAALSGAALIDLRASTATMRVDGTQWLSFDGVLENVAGGDGNDTISGNAEANLLLGGRGADILGGEEGNDSLEGGRGNDDLSGDAGEDQLFGNSGDDVISGGTGADTIRGGEGNDTLWGNSGDDVIGGSYGDDLAYGGAGRDTITTDAGFDTIHGGAGRDLLNGGGNADEIHGGSGDDQIVGELGTDHLYGDRGNDLLRGNSENDYLYGGSGDDILQGGTEQDRLYGGAGADSLYGEGGFDRLEGGAGGDLLSGGKQADNLLGEAGNDTLYGGDGLDRLFGGSGDDQLYGGITGDGLFGGAGADSCQAGSGDDRIFGGSGDDLIYGNSGNDTIYGNAGFDTIDAGGGNDWILGGFNADVFVFEGAYGNDTIGDFDATNAFEVIRLQSSGRITDFADLMANHLTEAGADLLIEDHAGNSIRLAGVALADLDESDFLFV